MISSQLGSLNTAAPTVPVWREPKLEQMKEMEEGKKDADELAPMYVEGSPVCRIELAVTGDKKTLYTVLSLERFYRAFYPFLLFHVSRLWGSVGATKWPVFLALIVLRRTIQMDQPWRQKAPMVVAGILLLGIAVLLFSQLGSPSGPSEAMPVPDAPPAADTKGDMEVAAGHDLSVMSMWSGLQAWYHGTADFVIGGCSWNVEFERYCASIYIYINYIFIHKKQIHIDIDYYVVLCLL